ncbi:ABC transporter permease [Bacteroidota bacterium]
MKKHFLLISIRNILKRKSFSIINIIGLAIGMAASILILLWIQDEISFDKYHDDHEQIYRLVLYQKVQGTEVHLLENAPAIGQAMIEEIPEVRDFFRLFKFPNVYISRDNNKYNEKRVFLADSTIFGIWSINFIKGNPETALNRPQTIVITESMSKKYFGNEDPMGQNLQLAGQLDFEVTGVIEDSPVNTHFHYDFIGSFVTHSRSRKTRWLGDGCITYVKLLKNSNIDQLKIKLSELFKAHTSEEIVQALNVTWEGFEASGSEVKIDMQNIGDVHLNSNLYDEIELNGKKQNVYIFFSIAIFIIILACINFINLSTSRSLARAREVAIKKVVGSSRKKLISQFLAESVFFSLIALNLGLLLVELFLPLFNNFANKDLSIGYLNNPLTIPILLSFAIFIGLISGYYPSLKLSAYKPANTIKGKFERNKLGSSVRDVLIVFQTIVTVVILTSTIIFTKQIKYINTENLGFDKENLLVVRNLGSFSKNNLKTFKEVLKNHSSILSASHSGTIPGSEFNGRIFYLEGQTINQGKAMQRISTDFDFAETYSIEIVDGRFFSPDFATDSTLGSAIINESGAKFMGLENPVGKKLYRTDRDGEYWFTIVGVIKDFNYESMHQPVNPTVFRPFRETHEYMTIRITDTDPNKTLKYIEDQWYKFTEQPFEFSYLEKDLKNLYANETRINILFYIFSFLAILISCLGLFGMIMYYTAQKTKEIGIRKSLGASVLKVLVLLSKRTFYMLVISSIIAIPISWYFMTKWLDNFAFKINIGVLPFIFSFIIVLAITTLTVGFQSVKAARANPVDSLRYE